MLLGGLPDLHIKVYREGENISHKEQDDPQQFFVIVRFTVDHMKYIEY